MDKRYIVFMYPEYEARGGWNDILRANFSGSTNRDSSILSFDSVGDAVQKADELKELTAQDWSYHVVDLQTGETVHDQPYDR